MMHPRERIEPLVEVGLKKFGTAPPRELSKITVGRSSVTRLLVVSIITDIL